MILENFITDFFNFVQNYKMRIYLIGYMGSGKTTVGKQLAKLLNYDFLDLDNHFEEKYNISISDFFEKYDENAFRLIELKLLKESFVMDRVVISTGGGLPCFSNNMEMMKENGITVYLNMTTKALKNRLGNAKRVRPLIAGLNENELEKYIADSLNQRKPFYLKADITINGLNCDIPQLVALIRSHPSFQ